MAGRPGADRHVLLGFACAAVLLAAADTYVVVLALTDMMAGVGLGIQALQKATPIVSGFLLGYVAVLPLVGRLADLLDRRRVLLGCLVIFVIGSVVTALAVDLGVLVAGRLLQGIGGGGLVPATLALVADRWPPERRGTPLGVVGAVQELGSVVGPLLGALVLAVADWRAIFWLAAAIALVLYAAIRGTARSPSRPASPGPTSPAPASQAPARPRSHPLVLALTLVAAALLLLSLTAPERLVTDLTLGLAFVPLWGPERFATPIGLAALALTGGLAAYRMWRERDLLLRADLPGALLLGTALGAVILTFATSEPEREVVGPLGLALLPVAVVAATAAVWHVRRTRHPIVPRGVLAGPTLVACLVSLGVGAALVAVVVDVPLFARLTHTDSQTEAAFVLLRFLIALPVGALLGGWLLRYAAPASLTVAGLGLAAVGLFAMSRWTAGALVGTGSSALLALVGLALGVTIAPLNAAALARVGASAHGVASSLVVVARTMGMVLGLALLTALGLHRYYLEVAALPDPTDPRALLATAVVQVQIVFLGASLAAALAAVGALALPRSRG